jgi:ATP:ADP antiporter, AAA family
MSSVPLSPLSPSPLSNENPTLLDQIVGFVTRVTIKPTEGFAAVMMAANVFVLLCSYYLLKTARESLILSEASAEVKSYAAAGQAILLLGVVPLYGWITTRFQRLQLVFGVTLFFVMNLILFAVVGQSGVRIGVPFYIWLGIFNLMIVSQFWALANDFYNEDQGKRLFPMIGIGSSLGAWVGSSWASSLFKGVSPYQVMWIAAGLLVGSLLFTWLANKERCGNCEWNKEIEHQALGKEGGFQLIFSQRYLLLMAGLVLLLNVVNSNGEYLLGKFVVEQSKALPVDAQKQFIGQFYGGYFTWVNGLGLFLQTFVAGALFRWIGVRGALFVLPAIALGGYAALLFVPVLEIVRGAKILENATDYSIQNTTRQALFLPMSREIKYKAKNAIDTFFTRAGDVTQAALVFLLASLPMQIFASMNLALVAVWLLLAWLLFKEHRRITQK